MLIHVTLKESDLGGRVTWKLLGPDGQPIDAFSTFADTLVRKNHPLNTRQAYCRHLAEFLDYLIEAGDALRASGTLGPLSRDHLQEIIESYHDYLVFGDVAGNRIASLVHQRRPSPKLKAASSALKHAAIRKFLKLSEVIRHQTLELAKAGLTTALVDHRPLLPGQHREPIPHHQRQAMIGSSMIAGVVMGSTDTFFSI